MGLQHPNLVLAALPAGDFELLRPHLKAFDLVQGDLLFDAGESINWVYFLHSGVVSLVVGLADGQLIETAMVGRDSLVGGSAALDGRVGLNRGLVQVEGACSTSSTSERCAGSPDQSTGFSHDAVYPARASPLGAGPAVRRLQRPSHASRLGCAAGCCGPRDLAGSGRSWS